LPDASVISIVDDDEFSRIGTTKLVRSLGFAAHGFASADAFLRSPHMIGTACLISDIQMPDVSGIQLLDVLRARGHDIPIIFVTAFPNEKVRTQALSRGAICFLAKPFDGETLERCIKTALKKNNGKSD
jgi:FixJ family two-component response regulator